MFQFQNKNIIILLKSFVLGGAEKQALHLANHLQNKLSCTVFIYSYIPSENSKLFYQECKKYDLNNLFIVPNPLSASGNFKYFKRRIKILQLGIRFRKHQPDVIIPYLNPPSIIANLCRKVSGAKTTFWHHRGVDYYREDALEKLAIKKTKRFIANSPNGKRELEIKFDLQNKKTHFLPNFSTMNLVEKETKDKVIEGLETKIVIGMMAHFRNEKLQSILFDSFVELLENYDAIHLLLVGNVYDSEEELSSYSYIINEIKKRNIGDKISIVHNCTAKDILPYFDIGVLVSKNEGMPNVIMEYMSAKLPIITTNHDGCLSLLGKDYDYFVNNTKEAICEKLISLLESKEQRKEIGEANYKKMRDNYSIETYIDNLTVILNA